MNKICTDIHQSKKLIELGIDTNTADMYYQWYSETASALHVGKGSKKLNADCPAWSLAALLKLMPKSIISTPNPFSDNYCCRNVEFDMEFYADNPVDAAFETLSWLLENKKL